MFSSKEILNNKTIAIASDNKNIKTIAIEDKEVDLILKDYNELISSDFVAWYAKCIKTLGSAKFIQLAEMAKFAGNNKPKYFSWLLKREITTK